MSCPFSFVYTNYFVMKCAITDVNVLIKATVSNQYVNPLFSVLVSIATRTTITNQAIMNHQSLATKIIQSIANAAAKTALMA